jgi:hypothetical protein
MRWKNAAISGCVFVAAYLRVWLRVPIVVTALLAIGSGLGGYLATSAVLRPPAPQAAAPKPPQPQASWVSYEEIGHEQKRGRLLLENSPAELLSLYERKGSDAVEAYRDKWVKIDYPIISLAKQTFGKTTFDVVEAAVHFQSAFPGQIVAYFSEQKWDARLLMHQPKDQIVAFCQFKEIQRESVLTNIHRLWFYAVGCDLPELVSAGPVLPQLSSSGGSRYVAEVGLP